MISVENLKGGKRRDRTHTDGSPLGAPIKWPHEEEEKRKHEDRELVPVKRTGEEPPPKKKETALLSSKYW